MGTNILKRRKTYNVKVGNVIVGSDYPVVIQSMTNTDTADAKATAIQIKELADAGSEMVRITVNNIEAANSVLEIRDILDNINCNVPIIGDFHFNGDKLLKESPSCAKALAKYRINPGNVGKGAKGDDKFAYMIEQAIIYDKPIRIGVNWGSLDQKLLARIMNENQEKNMHLSSSEIMHKALVTSALESAQKAVDLGLAKDKIILSCKVSNVQDLITLYRSLASLCEFPLHLGLTEAGMGDKGIISSSAALAVLLQEGIGDTIRISLTPEPGESRKKEVLVAQELLQSMGYRYFMPSVTACPGCGRTTSTFFQELAKTVQSHLHIKMQEWKKKYPGVENLKIAVMGCVVNGPGESKLADIGISLPGNGEVPIAPVYIEGKKTITLKGESIGIEFIKIVEEYINNKFSSSNDDNIIISKQATKNKTIPIIKN